MKHSFIASITDNQTCAKCKRDEQAHGSSATCESCLMSGVCEINEDDILMCATCEKRDDEIKVELSLEKVKELREELKPEKTFAEELITVAKTIEIDQELGTSQDFFNAETVAIVDLQKAIENDVEVPQDQKHFELVRVIRARYAHFRATLFEIKKVELEIVSRERALQYRLNDLAGKFRSDEREKLKLQDLTYIPKEIATKAPKVKLSPEEKLIEQYAQYMKISIEQATVLFNNKMKTLKPTSVVGETK